MNITLTQFAVGLAYFAFGFSFMFIFLKFVSCVYHDFKAAKDTSDIKKVVLKPTKQSSRTK